LSSSNNFHHLLSFTDFGNPGRSNFFGLKPAEENFIAPGKKVCKQACYHDLECQQRQHFPAHKQEDCQRIIASKQQSTALTTYSRGYASMVQAGVM
jgi:hypothetical protein